METLFALRAAKPRAFSSPTGQHAPDAKSAYRVAETITRRIARKKQ